MLHRRLSGHRDRDTGWTCAKELCGQLVGRLAALRALEASVTVWALESQAGQGLLGHLHGSGPGLWPAHRAPVSSGQRGGSWLQPPTGNPGSCRWSLRAWRPAQTRGRDVGDPREGRQSSDARAVCLGRGCRAVSAQQTMSPQAGLLTPWNTGFGSSPLAQHCWMQRGRGSRRDCGSR